MSLYLVFFVLGIRGFGRVIGLAIREYGILGDISGSSSVFGWYFCFFCWGEEWRK